LNASTVDETIAKETTLAGYLTSCSVVLAGVATDRALEALAID